MPVKKATLILSLSSIGLPISSCLALPDAGSLLQEELKSLNQQVIINPKVDTSPEGKDNKYKFLKTKIYVSEFVFTGDIDKLSKQQLDEIYKITKPFLNRKISIQRINYVAALVSNKIKTYGFAFPTVVLPNQEIEKGIVKLRVFIGKLQSKDLDNSISVNSTAQPRVKENIIVNRIGNELYKNPDYIHMKSLERSAFLVNDLSGITTSLRFQPGKEMGTTRVIADVKNAKPFPFGAIADNTGSRYTGRNKVTAFLSANSPTRNGDLAKIQTVQSTGVNLYGAEYTLPLMPNGLSFTASYLKLHYKLGLEFKGLNYKGEAGYATASVKYPIIRSRKTNFFITASLSNKILIDKANNIINKNKRVNIASIKLTGEHIDNFGKGGRTKASLLVTNGVLNLRRNSANFLADQNNGPKTNGDFQKLNFEISRMQNLITNTSINFSLSGQLTNKNLDSSEKMSVGGLEGIMAYPSGEGSSAQAFLFKTTLSYKIPKEFAFGQISIKGFYQAADLKNNYRLWNGWNAQNINAKNHYKLHGTGLGLSISNNKNFVLNLNYALKLGKNAGRNTQGNDSDATNKRHRILLQAMFML